MEEEGGGGDEEMGRKMREKRVTNSSLGKLTSLLVKTKVNDRLCVL